MSGTTTNGQNHQVLPRGQVPKRNTQTINPTPGKKHQSRTGNPLLKREGGSQRSNDYDSIEEAVENADKKLKTLIEEHNLSEV